MSFEDLPIDVKRRKISSGEANEPNRILEVFQKCKAENRPVRIAGPMVRYSKLPFRQLVREYNCDIVYSPMILAREFVRNKHARNSDFTTNKSDFPLVVQVGCNNVTDLLRFVEMIYPYCDAVGINCGCPVREQVREGIGAALMSDKSKVAKFVREVKKQYNGKILIEAKIRIHENIQETVDFVKEIEAAGVDWITIHGRTKDTRSSVAANFEAIRTVSEAISHCPVIANGDCFKPEDLDKIAKTCKVAGVMAVRGILSNPCIFKNYLTCTFGAIEKFWNYSMEYALPFRIIQHHLSCMIEDSGISRNLRKQLNECNSLVELVDWFDTNFDLKRVEEVGFGNDDLSILQALKTIEGSQLLEKGQTSEEMKCEEAISEKW